ncbi:MAG: penicillin-binding protein 2 [Acidobacteriota bacterium]|nr:penicillin-binding protein 2 [Acidobacteriota bacterium]MDE3030460.1 penicillin-binding protein 2 [Acidobacteriota bacterium]MDE3092440.1 penicillin-binding protein 2 [Acidobacteriota bacterium]MDE3146243.1 penicillin-binding protein 2 [Acidobacteriota bacterium]
MSVHASPTHARRQLGRRSSGPAFSPRRLQLVRGLFIIVFAALAARLVALQVFDHAHYAQLSVDQVRHDLTTNALRAGIYDRNGQVLAISEPTSMVIADDMQIAQPHQEALALSGLVKVPVAKLTTLLSKKGKGSGYVILNGQLDLTDGKAITNGNFPGIVVQDASSRSYPNGTLAESLLGRTNASGAGSTGLEYQYQSKLAGQTGITREFVSSSGVALPSTYSHVVKAAQPGVGLELTIDAPLQFVTERALATQLRAVGGLTGVALVMDVKTGQILADASLVNTATKAGLLGPIPAWGTSVGVPGIEQTINNLAFTQAYEPGSVFKVVTFSAALAAGVITPSSVFAIPNSMVVGGRVFHDAENHGLEHLSATQILAQSSNIGTYEVGTKVGENGILAQVQRLGFGQTTAVNFPGESAGLLVNAASWYASDQAALPIGQVDAVPPIQVLDAYNTVANGGTFVEPSLVRGYVQPNGVTLPAAPSAKRQALTPAVASTMNTMLQQVVLAGTGVNAIIPGYAVAGKTGTANIPYPGKDLLLNGAFYATFVGYAPATNPVLSMFVDIERPQTTIYGGSAAAPVFQRVMSYALRHYSIPSSGTTVRPLTGSASIASDVT